jgi:HTH-type transcriptional regulator / antitoxin HigA
MNIKPIRNEKEYEQALVRLEVIFDSDPETAEGEEAEILSLLIENYETQHHFIESPDPIEAIKIRLEEMDLEQKDLIGVIGSKSKVSEVLNKKRKLTLEMIRNLTNILKISPNTLIKEY